MRHTCPKGLVASLLGGKLENSTKDEDVRQDNEEQVQHHNKHGHSNAIDVIEACVPTCQPHHSHVFTVGGGDDSIGMKGHTLEEDRHGENKEDCSNQGHR